MIGHETLTEPESKAVCGLGAFSSSGLYGSFQNSNNAAANGGEDLARNVRHEMSFANGTFAEINSKLENTRIITMTNNNDMSHNSILSGGLCFSENQ